MVFQSRSTGFHSHQFSPSCSPRFPFLANGAGRTRGVAQPFPDLEALPLPFPDLISPGGSWVGGWSVKGAAENSRASAGLTTSVILSWVFGGDEAVLCLVVSQ